MTWAAIISMVRDEDFNHFHINQLESKVYEEKIVTMGTCSHTIKLNASWYEQQKYTYGLRVGISISFKIFDIHENKICELSNPKTLLNITRSYLSYHKQELVARLAWMIPNLIFIASIKITKEKVSKFTCPTLPNYLTINDTYTKRVARYAWNTKN